MQELSKEMTGVYIDKDVKERAFEHFDLRDGKIFVCKSCKQDATPLMMGNFVVGVRCDFCEKSVRCDDDIDEEEVDSEMEMMKNEA